MTCSNDEHTFNGRVLQYPDGIKRFICDCGWRVAVIRPH
jgi:hypothetical protein